MAQQNPFAQALGNTSSNKAPSSFTEALAGAQTQPRATDTVPNQTGFDAFKQPNNHIFEDPFTKKQKEMERQEYERKRLALHNKINPVDQRDIFNQREAATQKRIDSIRIELKNLAKQIKGLYKDIDIALMGKVTNTGLTGIGAENFFGKLREVIILLTKRVRDARTWAQQSSMYTNKKKKQRGSKGLGEQMNKSTGHEQRAAMDQFFNSERGDNMGE